MRLSLSLLLRLSTDVTKGLWRLHDLYMSGLRTRLFAGYRMRRRISLTEIGCSLFSDIREICKVKTYEPLLMLYNLALEHDLLKTEFFGE
jgi:hypothetical protein